MIEALRSGVLVSGEVEHEHGRVMIGADTNARGQNCLRKLAMWVVVSNRPDWNRWPT